MDISNNKKWLLLMMTQLILFGMLTLMPLETWLSSAANEHRHGGDTGRGGKHETLLHGSQANIDQMSFDAALLSLQKHLDMLSESERLARLHRSLHQHGRRLPSVLESLIIEWNRTEDNGYPIKCRCPKPPKCPDVQAAASPPAVRSGSEVAVVGNNGRRLPPVNRSWFCPKELTNYDEWKKLRDRMDWFSDAQGKFKRPEKAAREAQWWCDKVVGSIKPYPPKAKYYARDFAVAIATGSNLFFTRAAAARDTWLMRLPHAHMYAPAEHKGMPVISVDNEIRAVSINGTPINAETVQQQQQWIHLFAMRDTYRRHPDSKWYMILGCDNYMHIDHYLRLTDNFDHNELLWIVPSQWGPADLPPQLDLSHWPSYQMLEDKKVRDERQFVYGTGALGWIMSNRAMKLFDDNFERFIEDVLPLDNSNWTISRWRNLKFCGCHSTLVGMLMTLLGVKLTTHPLWQYRKSAYALDGGVHVSTEAHNDIPLYHFVTPYRMYSLDQFVTHEKIDRLQAGDDAERLIEYFHEFVDEHFEVLRRRQSEMMELARRHNEPLGNNDISFPLRPNMLDQGIGDRNYWYGERDYASMLRAGQNATLK